MRYEAKPRLYSLIIYMVGFIFCYNFSVAQTPQILLSRPTDHEMTVSILSPSSANYVIKYGTIKGSYSYATQEFLGQANMPSRVVLNDLLPNTKYYYILQYKFPNQSQQNTAEFSFHTQRAKGASFNFTIEADEHLYDKKGIKSLYEICLQNQAIEAPDFMFSLGDMFGDDHTPNETTDADMKDLHLDYLPFLSKITHSIPFYFCLGNHEGENGYYLMQNNGANMGQTGGNIIFQIQYQMIFIQEMKFQKVSILAYLKTIMLLCGEMFILSCWMCTDIAISMKNPKTGIGHWGGLNMIGLKKH